MRECNIEVMCESARVLEPSIAGKVCEYLRARVSIQNVKE